MALVAGPNPSGSRVALPSGFSLAASTAYSSYAEYDIVYCDTPKDCFDAVLEGKADIAFADTHVANYLLAEPQYESLSVTTITSFFNSMSIGVSRNADRRLVSILDRCVQYTAESKMTTWLSQSSLAVHPISPFDFLRQYPVQFMAGIVALLGSVLGVALYVSHVKLRAARRVEDFSFTDRSRPSRTKTRVYT